MMTAGNLLPLLYMFLISGCLVSSSSARQGDRLRVFMKIKATGDVDPSDDPNTVLPDFKPVLIPQKGSKKNDKISKLPGQPNDVNFGQYGGYITVNKNPGRALFYYFIEAQNNKDSKPVILWFNGGPGCSSLGFGAFEEIGPFLVHKEGLIQNPYSWNKLGNILFLESPAGVGFSYSNKPSDYTSTGDRRTAQEAYTFLINWLERFPEYKNNDFYLTGESYAGHYVPQLAYTILQQNSKGIRNINLKGISIGNPSIHDIDDRGLEAMDDSLGHYVFRWRHNLISDEDWNSFQKNCDFTVPGANRTQECQAAVILNYFEIDEGLDIYNIYGAKCYKDDTNVTSGPVGGDDPCGHNNIAKYLNNPEVVKALHAKVTRFNGYPSQDGKEILGKWNKWEDCRQVLLDTWRDSPSSILPILKHLITHGTRVMVFSGDIDAVIPYTATKDSIKKLGLVERKKWYPWGNKEISGSLVLYEGNLTLATVRGASHEVPMAQPRRALELIESFIEGKSPLRAKTKTDLSELRINQDDYD